MPPPNRDPNYVPIMTPQQSKIFWLVLKIIIPAFLLAIFLGDLGGIAWLTVWMFIGFNRLIKWAIKEDRKEKDNQEFDQSLWDELKDIEKIVTKAFKPEKPKKPEKSKIERPKIKCIMCDQWSNKGGRYCDDHDDGESFY